MTSRTTHQTSEWRGDRPASGGGLPAAATLYLAFEDPAASSSAIIRPSRCARLGCDHVGRRADRRDAAPYSAAARGAAALTASAGHLNV
jgi:hypothetical protein